MTGMSRAAHIQNVLCTSTLPLSAYLRSSLTCLIHNLHGCSSRLKNECRDLFFDILITE